MYSYFTSSLPTMTLSVGFKDSLRVRWVLRSCVIQLLSLLHRLFVVAQFVLVAFQCLMFVVTPISWGHVYSVDPRGYQHVATGVGNVVGFLPSPQVQLAMPCSSVLQHNIPFSRTDWYPFVPFCIQSFQLSLTRIQGPPSPKLVWAGPINAICQLVIILMANTFLAFRSVDIQA